MKTIVANVCLGSVLFFCGCSSINKLSHWISGGERLTYPAQITFHVVEPDGTPINGAEIWVSFDDPWSSPDGYHRRKGKTNKHGLLTLSENTSGAFRYSVQKVGYYSFGKSPVPTYAFHFIENNRWIPWNPTNTIVLKPVRNPISMYVSRQNIRLPSFDKEYWFDFEYGDLVHPYGSGKSCDLLLAYQMMTNSSSQVVGARVELSTTNEFSGLQLFDRDNASLFSDPYEAPFDGYTNKLVFCRVWGIPGKNGTSWDPNSKGIFFRTRTVVSETEELISAQYGKLFSPFNMSFSAERRNVFFLYYFNPDGTRNMEHNTNYIQLKTR